MAPQKVTRCIAAELDICCDDSAFVLCQEEENETIEENRPAKMVSIDEEKIRKVLTKVDFCVTIVTYGTAAIRILGIVLR